MSRTDYRSKGTGLRETGSLEDSSRWKDCIKVNKAGYLDLITRDTGEIPVRLFLTPSLLENAEETLYQQIVNATRFPGTKLVVITPDTHYGYGVPVGRVLLTDAKEGALAMGQDEGIIVNTDGVVPIDESSVCYKSSDEVIKAVVDADLAEIEHHLWPLASIKDSDERRHHKNKKSRPWKNEPEHTSTHY